MPDGNWLEAWEAERLVQSGAPRGFETATGTHLDHTSQRPNTGGRGVGMSSRRTLFCNLCLGRWFGRKTVEWLRSAWQRGTSWRGLQADWPSSTPIHSPDHDGTQLAVPAHHFLAASQEIVSVQRTVWCPRATGHRRQAYVSSQTRASWAIW